MPLFENIYRETEENIIKAVERFKTLQSENTVLRGENEKLKTELETTRNALDKTREKLRLTELKKTILTKEDSKELKQQISKWVRDIDESIKILESK